MRGADAGVFQAALETQVEIRRIDADYRPHIAIMTAIYKHTRYQNEARLKYGIDDYLIKPVLPQSLAGLVRRVQAAAS